MADTGEIPADTQQKRRSYRRNTGVFRGIDLRTVEGHQVRKLYATYTEQAGLDDDNLVHQGAALKVAKLQVIVERLHNELLKPRKHDQRLGDELVRHENMLRRAKLELNALTPAPVKWWEQDEDDDQTAQN